MPRVEPRERLIEVVDDIETHVERVDSLLSRDDASVFQAPSAMLETSYSEESTGCGRSGIATATTTRSS